MSTCKRSVVRGSMWVDRHYRCYPNSMCTAAWIRIAAIQTVNIDSTTIASITSLTSLNCYRAVLTSLLCELNRIYRPLTIILLELELFVNRFIIVHRLNSDCSIKNFEVC